MRSFMRQENNSPVMASEVRSLNFIRVIFFVALYAVMQFGWSSARDTWLERITIDEMTVKPAAWLINHITPEVMVQAAGTRLKAVGGGINILNGCEGLDVVFLLAAALLVAQLDMKWRLLGIGIGSIAMLSCNQLRILVMFYANRFDKAWFELFHGIIAPIALILIAAGFFMFWLEHFGRQSKAQNL
jgi:exosortase/archaeosortase family protein